MCMEKMIEGWQIGPTFPNIIGFLLLRWSQRCSETHGTHGGHISMSYAFIHHRQLPGNSQVYDESETEAS